MISEDPAQYFGHENNCCSRPDLTGFPAAAGKDGAWQNVNEKKNTTCKQVFAGTPAAG